MNVLNRWHRIQELFDRAADLQPPERRRYLEEQTAEDPDLRAEVEALLEADRRAPGLLDGAAAGWLSSPQLAAPAAELVGTRAGSCRLDALVAGGGMGDVYRATRSLDGSVQQVVVKVLRPGLHPEELRQRFLKEQETLAALRHPYIVTLLDSGTLADGRPFLVMESIDGIPVTRWCEETDAPVRGRLELFLRILAAVQYAHENLIVHRDLKPSNVLVTRDGVPKLLDFGIASLLSEVAEPDGGAQPLTPAYASPEQLRGEPVSTRWDVYALGALLHEMLTGRPAFEGAARTDPERLPRPPSAGVPERARRRALAGDLDAVVLKALHPDPEQRFASGEQLAAEIQRHLDGRPVRCRPQTLRYRGAKLLRRKPWLVSAVAVAVLAVAGGWTGSEIHRQQARAEARRGWGAHAEAKLAGDFLAGMLVEITRGEKPWQSIAGEYAATIPSRLGPCPEAEGLAALALGRLYAGHGLAEQAVPLLERAMAHAAAGSLSPHEERQAQALLEELQ